MAYRYHSQRTARRLAKKSRRNLIVTIIIILVLLYTTFNWILPFFINGLGFITGIVKPSQKIESLDNNILAPPVLNIPYEATNTAQINISGYASAHTKVSLFLEDGKKDTVETDSEGNFEFKDISLSLGTNNIYGKTEDEKVESLPSKLIKVTFDNERPDLSIFEPEDNKTIQGNRQLKIAGQTESQSNIFINDTRVVVDFEGKFSSIQNLNDGENIFNIKAVDQATNNIEVSRRVIFTP